MLFHAGQLKDNADLRASSQNAAIMYLHLLLQWICGKAKSTVLLNRHPREVRIVPNDK